MTVQASAEAVPVVSEVVVRLALPEERERWDALMHEHHYLGCKQFAGRGLRYVAEWNGQWLALLGWHKAVKFRRLHLCANNTPFLILPQGRGLK